ncbi:trace amine-associated receptor 6-like isoform X1 [Agrilus planipennis]|uniref:Trace amine-associated receptor 6-like isoform X1 n=1 Tax=Agrilus planipennis TaxID=224129 RepID=A0A1W4X4I1_AGRPL|nr:trace amine-associated receptor 6-like isoform X1 [Agrilus planipennis]
MASGNNSSIIEEEGEFYINCSGVFSNGNATDERIALLYKQYIPPMLIFCLASVIINIRVLLSVRWVRRPLSPTLHISLSLAAADACTSALLGVGLFINSLLPKINISVSCLATYTLEMFRLSGIIITVVHLLALSVNHYLGILKPLHYPSIMTSGKTSIVVMFLWIVPILFIATYFLVYKYYENCHTITFMTSLNFRMFFASLFIIPLILMIFCYTHILIIVKRQQKVWSQLRRTGSSRYRANRGVSSQQREMEGNLKAIYTTLLILGSCMIGWLPANINFLIICRSGCIISGESYDSYAQCYKELFFYINWTVNMLIILKTMANPIIYSYRMAEIKEGTRRMHLAISQLFCRRSSISRTETYISNSQRSQYGSSRTGATGGAVGGSATAFCRFNGNSAHHHRIISKNELANTLL